MSINVYINLCVGDLARSRSFFTALGFGFEEAFCDDTAIALRISEGCCVMLLTEPKFALFTPRRIADAEETSEVLTALQLASPEAVDRMMVQALAAGGEEIRAAKDEGFMYGAAFADPDGHIWEPFWIDLSKLEKAA